MVQLDRRLTEEELALLGHSELVAEEGPDAEPYDDSYPAPAGFRERLILGDLSW